MLGGCAGSPLEAPSPVPGGGMPTSFSAEAEPGAPVWPESGWWRGFGSAELDALLDEARARSLDLGAAAARVLQAEARARIAGAPLLPFVDADASVARSGPVDGAGDHATRLGLSVAASYEVDFWGRNAADLASARASLAASRYDRETVALTVTAAVASTYFQVLSLRDRLAIARLNLANAERVLALVESRVRGGAASPLDLARQRSVVVSQRSALPPLAQQEHEARMVLAFLLGRVPQGFQVTADSLAGLSAPRVAPGLPAALLARRPDIRRAEADLAAASADVAAARAAFFPTVRISAALASDAGTLGGLFQGANAAYAVGAALLQTIFDGGARRGAEDLTLARRLELVHAYQASVIAAFVDVETALVDVRARGEQESLNAEEVAQALIAFELAEIRYRAGAEDLLAVLDAQRTLYQAQDQLGQVRFDRFQAMVALFRALGGGWRDTETAAATGD
ncbi:MAG TPA: efflux transporter outer membrane subunit [Alphaproteobacteria bacterium]